MIIVCQECTKRYHIDPISLGDKGRKARCAACGHVWFQKPEESSESQTLFIPEEQLIIGTPRLKSSFLKRFLKLSIKILLIFALIGGVFLAFGFERFKNWIVNEIPQMRPLYSVIGISSENASDGLEIRQINVEPVGGLWAGAQEDGKKSHHYSFLIRGSIINTSSHVQALPVLKIRLKEKCTPSQQEAACPLQEWSHALSQPQILPGEVIQFEISVEHEHPPGGSFFVSF